VPVSFDYADESDAGPYPVPPDAPIEGGPNSTGDRHVLMVDRDACRLWELYDAHPQNGGASWTAGSGATWDLNSNQMRPLGWTSGDAAGLPILPGLARYEDVARGRIDHALRFTVSRTRRAYIYPARHFASSLTDPDLPVAEEGRSGTLITFEEDPHMAMEKAVISGVAFNRDEAKITVHDVPDRPGVAYAILGPIADANIDVDVIVQNVGQNGMTDLSFTVNRTDYPRTLKILKGQVQPHIKCREVSGDERIAKVSIVGMGMRSHAGIAAQMFRTLAEEGINIQMISTSEIKITVVIEEKYVELAVRVLHKAFELDQE